MPITEPLSIADVFAAAENDDPTQIADNAALRQQFNNRFAFDPEVSLWDENELKKKQKMQALREAAQRNKETVNPFLENQTEENKKIVMDDLDTLGGIGAGIGGLNIKNMSSAEIQDKILSITPKLNPQRGNISKKYLEQKKRAVAYGPDVASGIRGMTAQPESLNQKPIDRQRAEPSQEDGNRYTKAVKRGAANMLQTVALLHDFGYLGFERGMEAIGGKNIGQPIDSGLEPTQNKLFRTMEELKQERYQVSSENYNLITGAKNVAEQAESEGSGGTTAALSYLLQNGTFGDMGEFLAEVVPSLGFGLGAGAVARRSIGAAAERMAAKKAGSIARRAGETVDAARLAKFVAPVGGAIQGATIAATTDFAGSAGAEYSAQYNEGKNMGESIDYALRRSLAQAGVSGLGGSLLPMQFGNRLYTSVVQSAVQGVAGYASAAAGAAAVGEELAPEEAALNILMGVLTALPETIAVAGGEVVSRNQIMREVEEGLIDQSLQNKAVQEDEANIKAAYLAGVMGDVVNRLKESKTAGRSEATVREFINSVREENEAVDAVYMDVDSFNQTLDRYNVPLEDIFEMSPEIARQWERVEDIEGTIRIPLDELLSVAYKIDNDPLIKDILNSMRSEPLAPNAREANESLSRTAEEMKTDVKSIMENYEKIRLEQDDLASVQQLIRDDLKALEFGFEQKTGFNEQASTLVAAMYDSLAQKMGIPARDLYNSMPVRIVSNEQQAAQVLSAGDVTDPINREIFNQQLSEAIDKELIAIHEIKPEGLLHADRMGGLAVPSLGVVKKGNLSSGFGDITLIAPTTMIDPKGYAKPRVYGADIYSPRYPEIEYKFDSKELADFNATLDDARAFFEDQNYSVNSDKLDHRPHVRLMNDDLVRYQFLKDSGIDVEKQFKTEIVKSAATDIGYNTTYNFIGELAQSDFVFDQLDMDGNFDPASLLSKIREAGLVDEIYKMYVEAAVKANTSEVLKKNAERKRRILENFDDQAKRNKLFEELNRVKDYLAGRTPKPAETETTRQVFDRSATAQMINDIITQRNLTSSLRKHVDSIINRTMTHERIRDGYTPAGKPRYREHNLDNIVKILKKDLVGGESFNYGLGSVRARYTPQLKSLDSIKNHADRLVSTKDFNDIKEQVNSVYSSLQSKIDDYGTFDGWDNFDNMLKDVPAMGLDRALSENGFKEVPEDIKGEIAALLKVLAEMPTEYFEAKIERAVKLNEFAGAVVPEDAEAAVIDALRKNGIEDIRFYNKTDNPREQVIAGFADQFFQKSNEGTRGQIQFRKDKKGAVIIMGKNADFSTFAHEMGHHFLELNMSYARRPDAPDQLKADMETVMKWAGLDSDLGTWNSLTPEQKTEVHEKFAETFEAYMFTGKSPSNALREVFARFRTFMTAVYKNMARFMGINPRADLNPEITAVMDRLVATQDAIEEVQRQRNLEMLITPEMATELGIPFKEYDEMRQDHEAATEAAINELEQKTIKDLAWYRNLRNKHVAAFNSQAKRVRQQMREIAAKEVAEMPVYQAIAYLRQPVEKAPKVARNSTVVDTAVDNLLEAIAKYGGIDADEIAATWGTDKPESYKVNVGRVKKVARKGGLSIETVAERLAEDGYLQKDQYGQFDTRELEDLFTDSLSGGTYYSMYADFELFHHGDDYGLAMGELPAFPDAAKLNLEWIKAKYGEDSAIYNAIPKNGKYALASLDGFDPEAIASRFGYESADKMIREIVDAPAPKELIEQKSGELMQEGYSDLFDENAVNQAIDEAVHNDIRAQMLAREMAAISKMNGRHAELNAAAKAVAGNIISKSLIRYIRPSVFSATELRLARQYDKALRSGDTVEAARIKRNQLVNFHAAKRAHEVQAQIKSLKDLEQKVFGSDERLSKARDFNYVTLARAVMGMFDLSARQSDYVDQLNMIKEYDFIAWTELTDLVQGLPELKDYRDLTHAELDVVDAAIHQIWHLSKESQKFTVEGKRVERAAVIEELSKQADTKPVRSRVYKGPGSGNPKFQRTASNFISAIGHLRRAEQFFTWMDGGKSNGVFHKYLFNPIQDALTNYRLAQREMKKEILDIYSQFDKHEGKIDATEIGYTFNSKQDLLHAILHSGNESNKQRLVLGRQWGEQLEDGSIDYSRWDNFVQRMMNEGIVTKKDMDAAQRIWNLFDGYKKEAQKVHKRMNGRYFEELPKQPLNTPYGQYEGGYIPADYDPVESAEADIRSEKSAAESQKEQVSFATTGANFTKSRAQNFSDKLMLDLTRLPMHLDRELRYIHLEEQVRQVGGVLRSREFRKQLEGVAPYIKNILDTWLSAVATQQTYKPTSVAIADKTIETARRNTGVTLMAGNFINAYETLTSLPQILVAVSGKEMALSSAKYFANTFSTKSMTEEVRRLSPFMDTRLDQSMNEYRFQLENFVTNPSLLKKGTDFLHKHAYLLQQLIQVPLEVITWNAAYSEMVAKGMNDADAIHHADGVMRQYLNDMTPEGLSSVERSTPTVRAMLMFFGWFNMVGNTFITNTKLIKENHSGLARYGRYAYMYAMMMALPAILAKAQREIINDTLSEDEDDELWDSDMTNILINSQLEMITGMVPFGRDVAKLAMPKTEQNAFYAGRYSVSPLISMIENLSKTGSKIIDTTDDEKTVDYSQLAKGILQATTFTTGVPVTFVQRPLVYATDVLVDEDIEPENGVDVARGLMAGK